MLGPTVGVGPESEGFALSRTSLVGVGPCQRWSDARTMAVRWLSDDAQQLAVEVQQWSDFLLGHVATHEWLGQGIGPRTIGPTVP